MIDRLEESGMVERRRDPADRRAWQLFLTDKSKPMLDDLRIMAEDLFEQALIGMSLPARDALNESLTLIRANLISLPAPRTTEAANG
jgi:DNA-binding MarR family transcriptional regulator